MGYYLAPALSSLRDEVNRAHPRRDKTSDGWIGDASHAARKSDHNPDYSSGGVVRAIDIDHDGIDKHELRRRVLADPRTEYFIQDWLIYTRQNGMRPARYTGSNGHTAHSHTSLRHGATYEKAGPWGYKSGGAAPSPAPAPSKGKSVTTVASEVIAGKWGEGPDRVNRLRAAGYDPNAVQAEVNRRLSGSKAAPVPPPARKSVDQVAQEVIDGKWGNNPERSRRLQAAGYSASAVQAAVNRSLGSHGSSRAVRLSVGTLADQVINGQWGNGNERARRITAAGYDYQAVRAEVNRKLR